MGFHFEICVLGYRKMAFQVEIWGWEWMMVVFGIEIVFLAWWRVLSENETVLLGFR